MIARPRYLGTAESAPEFKVSGDWNELRIQNKQMRENFAWFRRLTLSLLKQHPGRESVAMKRRSCGWSDDFMMEILTGAAI